MNDVNQNEVIEHVITKRCIKSCTLEEKKLRKHILRNRSTSAKIYIESY